MTADEHQRPNTTATPYVACYILLRDEDKVAFLLRSNTGWMDGNYSLPAGRVEQNEPILLATIREASEEVGIVIKPSDLQHRLTLHRKSENGTLWVDVFFEATAYKGKPYNAEPDKHGELVWFNPNALPSNVVPYVHHCLRQIDSGQTYAEFGWN